MQLSVLMQSATSLRGENALRRDWSADTFYCEDERIKRFGVFLVVLLSLQRREKMVGWKCI